MTNVVDSSLPAILKDAFVPGDQWFMDDAAKVEGLRLYRVVLPYDYAILADMILKQKGYGTRLVSVRMAATDSHIICYVAEQAGFLRYQPDQGTIRLTPSGPTVREMAEKVAASLSENWTSASEFTYTNDVKLLVATVVKTDPPSSDALPGGQASGIKIDF